MLQLPVVYGNQGTRLFHIERPKPKIVQGEKNAGSCKPWRVSYVLLGESCGRQLMQFETLGMNRMSLFGPLFPGFCCRADLI